MVFESARLAYNDAVRAEYEILIWEAERTGKTGRVSRPREEYTKRFNEILPSPLPEEKFTLPGKSTAGQGTRRKSDLQTEYTGWFDEQIDWRGILSKVTDLESSAVKQVTSWTLNYQELDRIDKYSKDSLHTMQRLLSVSDQKPHADLEWNPRKEIESIINFREMIASFLVESSLDDKRFLPESSISQLITVARVKELLPSASVDLVQFVCGRARRVFLTVLWSYDSFGSELVSLTESLRQHGMNDNILPIEDITIGGKCKVWGIGTSSNDSQHEQGKEPECTHDVTLNVFHSSFWHPRNFSLFQDNQWMFSSPVFQKYATIHHFHERTILPFTWVSTESKEGSVSRVSEAKLRADHQDEFPMVRRRDNLGDSSFLITQ